MEEKAMGLRSRTRALLGSTCAVVAVLAMTAQASARTPIPRVTGPLPVSSTSYPFGAADH
jgi:hypothetical protein